VRRRRFFAGSLALALQVPVMAWAAGPVTNPADQGWTEQITQSWLHRLERGEWPLMRFVDESAGLAVIDYNVDSGREDFKPHTGGRRLCGDKLAKMARNLNATVVDAIHRSDATECHNRPGPPWCRMGVLNEYMTFTYLVFRPGADRKLRLDAVLYLDGLLDVPQASRDEELRFVREELRRQRAIDCAGKATPAPPDYQRLQF
jgi:hypothetical protein